MGHLRNIWGVLQNVKRESVYNTEPDYFKITTVLIESINQYVALDSFYFSRCAMDKNEPALYALIGLSPSEPELVIPLMRDDLNDLQISIDELKETPLEANLREAFDRLETVVDQAIHEMNIHEKTAAFVRRRAGISDEAIHQGIKAPLRLIGASFG